MLACTAATSVVAVVQPCITTVATSVRGALNSGGGEAELSGGKVKGLEKSFKLLITN